MPCTVVQTSSAAMPAFKAGQRPPVPASIIADETDWRVQPRGSVPASTAPRVRATRWRICDDRNREVRAETADDCHVVAIVLRNMDCHFSVSGRTVQDGIASAGMVHVTEPAVPSRCLFRGPAETLHLYVPNNLIAECGRGPTDGPSDVLPPQPALTRDLVIGELGRALLKADEVGEPFGPLYADSLSVAIVTRLLASSRRAAPSERPRAGLPKWRLKRAVDYIESSLAEPVSLADIASATGLSRMHFAAQFRAATGLRPHEYLLRRRIERAQEMLLRDEGSLADIALSVGFQSQSHFTTVFKQFAGKPPAAWRQSLS